jgi:hypothetical protein
MPVDSGQAKFPGFHLPAPYAGQFVIVTVQRVAEVSELIAYDCRQ